ncbi:MAG TPA: amino acid ABC transporter permease [Hansschlegelia sp.]
MNGFAIVWQERALFLEGLWNTVSLVAAAIAISVPLSALGAVVLVEAPRPVARLARALVDLMRCVPFLLLAYVIYYGLPQLGLRFDAWWAGLVTMTLYNAAYLAEIFRSAWLALPKEGFEAARAYGFRPATLYRRIVLPQIAYASAPLVGGQIIVMIKDSALLMIITVREISFAANSINANYFTPFAPFVVAIGMYWMLSLIVEAWVRRVASGARLRYG